MCKDREISLLIVIPTLNEQLYIHQAIKSIIDQKHNFRYTIVVADGGSRDDTLRIVKNMQRNNDAIQILLNEDMIQSCAVNRVAQSELEGNILVRVDAHARYPENFLADCVKSLCENAVASVVVPMRTVGVTRIQKCIAFAQNSLIGTGGSYHRRSASKSKLVDHGHHALIWRKNFVALGGYNTSFTHNEDAEFDYRLRQSGGLIWMCSEATIEYYPRKTFGALWHQYRKHGAGRAKTIMLHKLRPRLRQAAPLFIVTSSIISLILSVAHPYASIIFLLHIAVYILFSLVSALRFCDISLLGVGIASAIMHISWTFGFLLEVKKQILGK